MNTTKLQINRFGSVNNIVTRVRHILEYDFAKLDYLELVFEVTFSHCDTNTDADILDFSYWYQDLHDALKYFELKGACEVKDLKKLAKSINKKLDEVHMALVTMAPEEWPEYQYLIADQENKTTNKSGRQPKASAAALYREIAKLLNNSPELKMSDFWPHIEQFNGKTVDLLNLEFRLIENQDLRMNTIREQLLCGCIEVTNLVNDQNYRKSKADFNFVSKDCGLKGAATLSYGAIEKKLNSMKKALKINIKDKKLKKNINK